jgi:hypothetical protein
LAVGELPQLGDARLFGVALLLGLEEGGKAL